MADQFFPRLPQGPVRLSKGYLSRLQRAVEQTSRQPAPPTWTGTAGVDSCGPYQDPQPDRMIWAEITAQPGDDEDTSGYSWQQREPLADGGFGIPLVMLEGNNGTDESPLPVLDIDDGEVASGVATFTTTADHEFAVGDRVTIADTGFTAIDGERIVTAVPSATEFEFVTFHPDAASGFLPGGATVQKMPRARYMPAFNPSDPDDESPIEVGTIVTLVRGFLDTGGAGYDYHWLILAGGGGTSTARLRVTGRPFVQDDGDGDKRYYPAVIDLDDDDGPGYHAGGAVWLVQRDEGLLDTRGVSHYTATRKLASFAVTACDDEVDERPLYCTTQKGVVTAVDFDTCTAYADYVYEGEAICDTLIHESEAILHEGELIGVG